MAEQVEVCVTEFLHLAPAWSADPARRDEELRDPARRMIYWVMKESWAKSSKKEKKAQPDFLEADRSGVVSMLASEMEKIQLRQLLPGNYRVDEEQLVANYSYAELAIISADSTFAAVYGDTASLYKEWRALFQGPTSYHDWADAPIQLRLQDCETAIRRGGGGKNLGDPAIAVPTSAPIFAAPQASAPPPTTDAMTGAPRSRSLERGRQTTSLWRNSWPTRRLGLQSLGDRMMASGTTRDG